MRIIAHIIKGILMYSTLIYWILAICLTDSCTFNGLMIIFGIGFALIYICKTFITLKDVAILTCSDPKKIKNETI